MTASRRAEMRKERVVRAAMRWYLWFTSERAEAREAHRLVKEFDAACAALARTKAVAAYRRKGEK